MPQLVVHLPGEDHLLIPVMPCQSRDNLFAVATVDGAAEAVDVPAAEGSGRTSFKLGENVGVLMNEPGRRRGRGGAEDHPQSHAFCHGDDAIKEGEIICPFPGLHAVPGKFADADDVAAQLHHALKIRFQHGFRPLLGIVVYAKYHGALLSFVCILSIIYLNFTKINAVSGGHTVLKTLSFHTRRGRRRSPAPHRHRAPRS